MQIDEAIEYCRDKALELAPMAGVGVEANGDIVPGQLNLFVWKLRAPMTREQPWSVRSNFVLDRNVIESSSEDRLKQYFMVKWVACLLSMWEIATKDAKAAEVAKWEAEYAGQEPEAASFT